MSKFPTLFIISFLTAYIQNFVQNCDSHHSTAKKEEVKKTYQGTYKKGERLLIFATDSDHSDSKSVRSSTDYVPASGGEPHSVGQSNCR